MFKNIFNIFFRIARYIYYYVKSRFKKNASEGISCSAITSYEPDSFWKRFRWNRYLSIENSNIMAIVNKPAHCEVADKSRTTQNQYLHRYFFINLKDRSFLPSCKYTQLPTGVIGNSSTQVGKVRFNRMHPAISTTPTAPDNSVPSKGVLLPWLFRYLGSTCQVASGSKMQISAGAPGVRWPTSIPRICAG